MLANLRRRALYAIAVNDKIENLARSRPELDRRAYKSARRYVAGTTLDEAMATVEQLHDRGFGVSLDMFGEGTSDEDAVARIVDNYRAAATRVDQIGADVYLEIVPSNLGLDVCRRHVDGVVEALPPGARLEVSAEESWRTPQIMDLTLALVTCGAANRTPSGCSKPACPSGWSRARTWSRRSWPIRGVRRRTWRSSASPTSSAKASS